MADVTRREHLIPRNRSGRPATPLRGPPRALEAQSERGPALGPLPQGAPGLSGAVFMPSITAPAAFHCPPAQPLPWQTSKTLRYALRPRSEPLHRPSRTSAGHRSPRAPAEHRGRQPLREGGPGAGPRPRVSSTRGCRAAPPDTSAGPSQRSPPPPPLRSPCGTFGRAAGCGALGSPPFAGPTRSHGHCGRRPLWRRFRVRGAQWPGDSPSHTPVPFEPRPADGCGDATSPARGTC